jgi:hypothetical protein
VRAVEAVKTQQTAQTLEGAVKQVVDFPSRVAAAATAYLENIVKFWSTSGQLFLLQAIIAESG